MTEVRIVEARAEGALRDGGLKPSATSVTRPLVRRYFTEEKELDFRDVRVCIHDGYGEATGKLDYGILGLQVEIKLKGTMDLTGDAPKIDLDDIDFGSIPGGIIDVYDALLPTAGAIDEALDDIELKHTYTTTLTEGQVRIDGAP